MWIIGIDEAGYGPNLGPFVMTSVACRVPDPGPPADLWALLRTAVRRSKEADRGQLFIDDSKLVYTAKGLAGLESGVLTTLWSDYLKKPGALAELIDFACPDDGDELRREVWYRGMQTLPIHSTLAELEMGAVRFEEVCAAASLGLWQIRSVIVCPPRFNALLDEGGTKGHVLAHALTRLLRWVYGNLPGEDELAFFIDKHGGRNTYAAMIHHALPHGVVVAERESMACSNYRVHGLSRGVQLRFQPRADAEHLCVALASMASKYLREVLMLEFNRFWQEHLPDLKPTAGYPSDAARFLQAIRPTIEKLGLRQDAVWRKK
jgi:ribonuclease HII